MKVNIADLHPTQLYLSEKKLQDIQMLYQSAETIQVDPISILAFRHPPRSTLLPHTTLFR